MAVEASLTTIGAVPTFLASVTLRHAGQKWSKKGVKGGLPAPKSAKFGVVGLDEVRGGVGRGGALKVSKMDSASRETVNA